jgi:hypothetical protein
VLSAFAQQAGNVVSASVPLLAITAGVLLGLVSRASDLLPREVGWLGNLAAIWLAAAFAVGSATKRSRTAGVAGSVTLAIAALVHYASGRLLRHGLSTELLGFPLLHWIVIGTALGALFGALGSVWRRGRDRTPKFSLLRWNSLS